MWDVEQIQRLLTNQEQENAHLEFKAGEGLEKTEGRKKDISKDVSSFANSDGGPLSTESRKAGTIEPARSIQ
jgi:predicted HTH transcriptional regulator